MTLHVVTVPARLARVPLLDLQGLGMKERHLEEEELVLRKLCSPACLDDVHSEFACTIVIRKALAIAAVQDPTELIPDDDECKDRLGASPCPFVCQFFVRTRRQGLPTAVTVTAYAFSGKHEGNRETHHVAANF